MFENVILFLRLLYLLYIFFLGISATWALQLFLNYMQPQTPTPKHHEATTMNKRILRPTMERRRSSVRTSQSPLAQSVTRASTPPPPPPLVPGPVPVQHMKTRAHDYHMPTAEALATLSKERSSPSKSESKRRERSSSSSSVSSRSSRSSRSSSTASGERRTLRWERSKGARKETSVSRSPKSSPEDAALKEHRRLKNLSRYLKT